MLNKAVYVPKRLAMTVAAICVAVAVMVSARPALAATGVVTQVEYNVSAHILGVTINGVQYLAQTTSPGCGISVSSDELKMIQSIAQASYLSGRTVSIGTTVCNSQNYINDIALF